MNETWPESADAVVAWIRTQLTADAEFSGVEGIRISAELDGDDLVRVAIDASDAELSPLPSAQASVPVRAEREVRTRRTGTARLIRVIASPVLVSGVPLTIDAEARDVPIDWVEYVEPADAASADSAYDIRLRDEGRGMSGSLTFAMRTGDVEPLIERTVRTALETGDARIRRLRVTVQQDGIDGVRLTGSAAIRYKLLFTSARGEARVRISEDGVVTVEDLQASSRNPLVALALRVARRSIRAQIGRQFDLAESLGTSGPRLHGVRVRVDRDLRVDARLG